MIQDDEGNRYGISGTSNLDVTFAALKVGDYNNLGRTFSKGYTTNLVWGDNDVKLKVRFDMSGDDITNIQLIVTDPIELRITATDPYNFLQNGGIYIYSWVKPSNYQDAVRLSGIWPGTPLYEFYGTYYGKINLDVLPDVNIRDIYNDAAYNKIGYILTNKDGRPQTINLYVDSWHEDGYYKNNLPLDGRTLQIIDGSVSPVALSDESQETGVEQVPLVDFDALPEFLKKMIEEDKARTYGNK